jgi:hypothetical protein
MRKHRVLLQGIVGSLATFGLAAMATAAGPDVVVTDAKIEAGKLVITGKTTAARTHVRLNGRSQADFNTISGRDRTFRFDLVYLPKDCIVSLQKLQGSQLGAETDAVIANCAPSNITARGQWNDKTLYEGLDLVSHGGASWLAMRRKASGEPGKSGDWQLFAAGVSDGKTGQRGPGGRAPLAGVGWGSTPTLVSPAAVPTGPAGGDLTGTYPNPRIEAEAVTTGKIAAQAVTTVKIRNAAIIERKIADGAVTGAKIALGTITGDRIAADSITSSKIAPGAVGARELDTIHEHFGPATNVTDGIAHDGIYGPSTSTVACGLGERLLSVSVDWTNLGGHNEVFFSGVDVIDRTTNPQTATVRVGFDGGAGPATYVAVATCIF